jgi:hypothetical protein
LKVFVDTYKKEINKKFILKQEKKVDNLIEKQSAIKSEKLSPQKSSKKKSPGKFVFIFFIKVLYIIINEENSKDLNKKKRI